MVQRVSKVERQPVQKVSETLAEAVLKSDGGSLILERAYVSVPACRYYIWQPPRYIDGERELLSCVACRRCHCCDSLERVLIYKSVFCRPPSYKLGGHLWRLSLGVGRDDPGVLPPHVRHRPT